LKLTAHTPRSFGNSTLKENKKQGSYRDSVKRKKKYKRYKFTAEHRKKLSKAGKKNAYWKGKKLPLEIRKKISKANSGERHGNWQGGRRPHPPTFSGFLKNTIRERDNYMCQVCGKNNKSLDRKLCVHHIDYDKKNNDPLNLISLCDNCHGLTLAVSTQPEWKKILQRKIKKYSDAVNGKILHKISKTKHSKNFVFLPDNLKSMSEKEIETILELNPFVKEINRHYGTFKAMVLGNFKKKFELLDFVELKRWGRAGTGVKRKQVKNSDFSLTVFSNGTVVIKPTAAKGLNPRDLQADFWEKARNARRLLSVRHFVDISPLELIQRPKYGVEDKLARKIKGEWKGKHRGIDSSPGHPHVDNYGAQACIRDLKLSNDSHAELAEARIRNPEWFERIENVLERVVVVNSDLAKNINLHLGVERRQLDNMGQMNTNLVEMNRLLKSARPRAPRLPARRNSATLRGVS